MGSESAVPAIKRVELSDGKWIELRTKRLVSDVRYQREQRHARGDYDDFTLDQLALVEARIVGWNLTEKVPADMELRRTIIDGLEEEDALKLVYANMDIEERPKDSPARSRGSSTGTSRNRKRTKTSPPSTSDGENGPTSG